MRSLLGARRTVFGALSGPSTGLIIRGAWVRLPPGPCGIAAIPLHAVCDVRRLLHAVADLLHDLEVASEVAS